MNDLEKVKENGLALQYVEHQTEVICLAAVKQNGSVLRLVKFVEGKIDVNITSFTTN